MLALGLTSLLNDIGSEMMFPLLPAFVASLGAGPAFLGIVEGVADATSSLLKLATGAWSDRIDRKRPLVLFGYGVTALVRPIVAIATAPWQVLAVRVSDRIGKGVRSAPRDVLLAESVDATNAGRAFGFHRSMDHAGAVIGPLVGAAILATGASVRTVFAVAVIPGILSVLAVLTLREEKRTRPTPSDAAVRPISVPIPPALRSYFGILAVFALGNSSDAFLLLRAQDLGLSLASMPILWTVFHVAKLGSSYVGGTASDRFPRARVIVLGWAVYALAYLAFAWATESWQAWAIFIVYGVYYGLTEPVEKALVKDLAPAEIRGRAFGLYNFIVGASAIPASVLTGWLWQAAGPKVALGTGAALAALASLSMGVWSQRTHDQAR